MSIPRPLRPRRLAAAVSALVLLTAGCAAGPPPVGAPRAAVPRAAVSTPTPASPSATDPRPAVTVPPLTATDPNPSPAGTTPAPPVDPPAATPDAPVAPTTTAAPPAAEPPAAETADAAPPPPSAAPDLPLPALAPPYDHVLGSHGSARTVYLTFDDGPGPQTPAVLDVLAAAGVRATFCQVGDRVAEYPDAELRVIADGHTLCNHSWDHQLHLGSADAAVIDAEIGRAQDALTGVGATAHWFRAPGGDFGSTDVLRRVAQSRGVVPLGWGVDSLDWTRPGVDAIVGNVLSQVSPGAVVLLHDAGGADRDQTIAALPRIIDGLRAAGYDLQPLPPGGL